MVYFSFVKSKHLPAYFLSKSLALYHQWLLGYHMGVIAVNYFNFSRLSSKKRFKGVLPPEVTFMFSAITIDGKF